MQDKPKVVDDDDSTMMAQMVCSLTNREECMACGSWVILKRVHGVALKDVLQVEIIFMLRWHKKFGYQLRALLSWILFKVFKIIFRNLLAQHQLVEVEWLRSLSSQCIAFKLISVVRSVFICICIEFLLIHYKDLDMGCHGHL